MNITLLLNRDPASAYALSLLGPKLGAHRLRVFYTDKPSRLTPLPRPLVDLGVFEKVQLASLNSVFIQFGAKRLNDINGNDFQHFEQTKPDLVISIRHMSILHVNVISCAKYGVINLHSGLLPNYQGVMATFWAMKNAEPEIGTSLHRIENAQIDTGPIIAQSRTPTRFDKSYFWNVLNIYQDGCNNIANAVQHLDDAQEVSTKPQYGTANYYSYPRDQDFAEFDGPLFCKGDLEHFMR